MVPSTKGIMLFKTKPQQIWVENATKLLKTLVWRRQQLLPRNDDKFRGLDFFSGGKMFP